MNERIKELAEKSYYECPQVTSYMWENDIVPPEQWTKFAKLIVRECISIIDKSKDEAINNRWNVDEAMSVAEMELLEHFGVE